MTCIDCRYFVKIPEARPRCEVFGHSIPQCNVCPDARRRPPVERITGMLCEEYT